MLQTSLIIPLDIRWEALFVVFVEEMIDMVDVSAGPCVDEVEGQVSFGSQRTSSPQAIAPNLGAFSISSELLLLI